MKTRKRFAEPPFNFDSNNPDRPYEAELVEMLTWYELDNGMTVSVLHSVWGWEVWAFPTDSPPQFLGHKALTQRPVVFDSEDEALAYRDGVAELPAQPSAQESEGSPEDRSLAPRLDPN